MHIDYTAKAVGCFVSLVVTIVAWACQSQGAACVLISSILRKLGIPVVSYTNLTYAGYYFAWTNFSCSLKVKVGDCHIKFEPTLKWTPQIGFPLHQFADKINNKNGLEKVIINTIVYNSIYHSPLLWSIGTSKFIMISFLYQIFEHSLTVVCPSVDVGPTLGIHIVGGVYPYSRWEMCK